MLSECLSVDILHVFGCPLVTDVLTPPPSIEEPMLLGAEDDREERPALVPSLFPLMPPTLYFSTANEKGQDPAILMLNLYLRHLSPVRSGWV